MGRYKLAVYLKPGIGIGFYYEHKEVIEIKFLCFDIYLGLTKDAKGIFIIK